MNCYNGEAYLREAINSILAQTYPHWELIFFDNASTDETQNIVSGYGDARIHYLRATDTVPLGEARNTAIREACGDFIAFLDSDDRWLPNKLESQLRCYNEHPDCDFLYGNYYTIHSNGGGRRIWFRRKQPHGDVFASFLRQYPVCLGTVMIRTRALMVVDELFDASFELSEEYELFMRILFRIRAAYVHEPLVEYRIHDKMTSRVKLERYPVEYKAVIARLARMIPNFQSSYSCELSDMDAKLAYYEARVMMSQNRVGAARQLLFPYSTRSWVYFGLYLLTYSGVQGWRLFHRWIGKVT